MKKLLYVVMSSLLLVSCYEDKGNYNYTFDSLNKVDISHVAYTPEAYAGLSGDMIEIQMPMTEDITQRVEAKLNQSLFDNYDNLDFTWFTAYSKEEKDPKTNKTVTKTVRDTLHTNGYVDLEFPANTDRNYSVKLAIKDKTTDLDYYAHLNVKTRLLFKNSLFFLHQKGNETFLGNVEKIGSKIESRSDAYKTAKPSSTDNLFSKAMKLGYAAFTTGREYLTNLMVFNSDGRGNSYNTAKALERYGLTLMPGSSSSFVVNRLVSVGNTSSGDRFYCLLSRDGRFYTGNVAPYFMIPANSCWDETLQPEDYEVTAATITSQYYLLWDAKNSRFIYQAKDYVNYFSGIAGIESSQSYNAVLDAHVDFSSLGTLSPVGKKAVYGFISSQKEFYDDAKPQFIFKDDADNYYLYELTPFAGGKARATRGGDWGDDGGSSDAAFTITAKRLTGFNPGSNLASITYNPWFSTNFIFFAKDDQVIRHNLSNGDEEVIYTAPVGYTVSVIKFRTDDSESNSSSSAIFGDLGLYLSIGMNKGSNGAVAEMKLTTAGDVDESYQLFADKDTDGNAFGRIIDVQFAHVFTFGKDSQ